MLIDIIEIHSDIVSSYTVQKFKIVGPSYHLACTMLLLQQLAGVFPAQEGFYCQFRISGIRTLSIDHTTICIAAAHLPPQELHY